MHDHNMVFVKDVKSLPLQSDSSLQEWAFCGRSNVGKSSLFNALLKHSLVKKNQAKISKTPGRTRSIGYIQIGKNLLLDLPGYGYAKVSKSLRYQFLTLLHDYVMQRRSVIFVLIDIRRGVMSIDQEFFNLLETAHHTFSVLFTKSDKYGIAHKHVTSPWEDKVQQDAEKILNQYNSYNNTLSFVSSKTGYNILKLKKLLKIL